MKAVLVALALVLVAGASGLLVYGIAVDRGGGDGSGYIMASSFAAVAGAIAALLVPRMSSGGKPPQRNDD